jgi:hemin uptake protein HemP
VPNARALLFGFAGTQVEIVISHEGQERTLVLTRAPYTVVFGGK